MNWFRIWGKGSGRVWRVVGGLVVAWGLVWLLAWAALPAWLRIQVAEQASQALGRRVSVGAVEVRPWSLEVSLHDLRVADAQGPDTQLEVRRIDFDADLASLWRLAPVVDALQVQGVRLRVTHRGGGQYDLDDVLQRLLTPSEPPEPVPRFALYNIVLSDVALDFVDAPARLTHEVRDLRLTVPFLSTLPAQRTVMTEPRLTFRLNGSAFDSAAQTQPFAPSHKTDATLSLQDVDLQDYAAYWPRGLPVKPQAGRLSARLQLFFEENERPLFRVRGQIDLQQLRLSDARDEPVLALENLQLQVSEFRPLERLLEVQSLRVQGPEVSLQRRADGKLPLLAGLGAQNPDAASKGTSRRPSPSGSAEDGPPAPGWKLSVAEFSLQSGRMHWRDDAATAPVRLEFQQVSLGATALAWPAQTPAQVQASGTLTDRLTAVRGRFSVTGEATPESAVLDIRLADVRLPLSHPYLAPWIPSTWHGQSSASQVVLSRLRWSAASAGAPWRASVEQAQLRGGALHWEDRGPARPVRLDVSGLEATLHRWVMDSPEAARFSVSGRVQAADAPAGGWSATGTLALQPALAVQAQIQARSLPVHILAPYLADSLNVNISQASAGARGHLSYVDAAAGPSLKWAGDLLLEDVLATTLPSLDPGRPTRAEELLNFRALNLQGLQLVRVPEQPLQLSVRETALSDFYARVIVNERGRINLLDLVKPAEPSPPGAAAAAGTGSQGATAGLAPRIEMGPVSLVRGRVLFSDRFIQPNYTANLTALNGRLGAFSSTAPAGGSPALAELSLSGRAEGSATLQVSGKLNPLADPLALDIRGQVRDLELAPLSPYSVKFAGHGIQRGKLSMDVTYRVQPDGQLSASHQIVLNQLTFGDKVDGAPNSLPVRLAVALLADRNGVIDVNLPVSGSINDPEFRLGPILWKVVVNLVSKAITAPFSLLASMFGGGVEEGGQVVFAPGSAQLTAATRQRLEQVAEAMKQRPALQLTLTGFVDPQSEREAYRREQLQAQLLAEKRRQADAAGRAGTAAAPTILDIEPAERSALLQALYRRAQIPKPRNLIGLARDLPAQEVEALLLASIPAADDVMRALAFARSVAVRDELVDRGVPVQRLFLGDAQATVPQARATPRVQLHLATS